MNKELNFDKSNGLIPAVIQDSKTNQVLMLGYMDRLALEETRKSGKVTFYSRSKQRLWTKGETSGNFLELDSIHADCDGDTLLISVRPQGPTCHLGTDTCFGSDNRENGIQFLQELQKIIKNRKETAPEGSYTASLFAAGINKIAQKVGEEAVEVVIEAKESDTLNLKEEAADLLFHLMVLLEHKEVSLDEVVDVLRERHGAAGK
ncbi:MAG: bifunctional phosphoribosyl-AMP cyclohydrolase/phosphoribosyl-ATP diphosphatase HisIE [Bacteroidetes bacterium]|nr:MAG: bifunctional phosphoribosyl-AMP cyclohydrolase/phosphoribosyl-ATP diphosphatase HisIE [Bacteroidota bacterium]